MNDLVQAAAYIAGTLACCYHETVITDQRCEFIELLRHKLRSIRFFPDSLGISPAPVAPTGQDYNETLATLSIKLANDFLHRKSLNPVPQMND